VSLPEPEFDRLSTDYDQLLRDPIRDKFTEAASEFFHLRKRDLIRHYFTRRKTNTRGLSYLDVGCGKGELLTLLREDFARVAGCDPSAGMLEAGGLNSKGMDARIVTGESTIPFDDAQFDFVTAVCVYHHVALSLRDALTLEVHRVLRPGGVFSIIEHNPYNPVTRLIVSRTPVDADAILLTPSETRAHLTRAGFKVDGQDFFLYFPERWYRKFGALEKFLRWAPVGGQYAAFARKGPIA
jgi:SAM-dependent methyltransferase